LPVNDRIAWCTLSPGGNAHFSPNAARIFSQSPLTIKQRPASASLSNTQILIGIVHLMLETLANSVAVAFPPWIHWVEFQRSGWNLFSGYARPSDNCTLSACVLHAGLDVYLGHGWIPLRKHSSDCKNARVMGLNFSAVHSAAMFFRITGPNRLFP